MQPVKLAADVESCSCLRCRGVGVDVTRRSVGADALWGLALVRLRPSLVAFAVVLAGIEAGRRFLDVALAVPVVGEVFDVPLLLVGPVLAFRGYVVAVAVGELNERATAGEALSYALRRSPAIVGATLAQLVVTAVAVGLTIVGVIALGTVAIALGIVGPDAFGPLFSGASGAALFGSVGALFLFKFWLAPDICVAGGYGPIRALRLSWEITASHTRRLLFVVIGAVLTALAPMAFARMFAALGNRFLLESPGFAALGFLGQSLLYAVWFSIGTQIYVRAALDR